MNLDSIKNGALKVATMLRPHLPETLQKAITEPGGKEVSSTRVWGGITFAVLLLCNMALVGTICWGIRKVLYLAPVDNVALASLLGSIKNLAWLYLVLAATALSLYGINVWKYINTLKNGLSTVAKDVEDSEDSDDKPATTETKQPIDSKASVVKPDKDDV